MELNLNNEDVYTCPKFIQISLMNFFPFFFSVHFKIGCSLPGVPLPPHSQPHSTDCPLSLSKHTPAVSYSSSSLPVSLTKVIFQLSPQLSNWSVSSLAWLEFISHTAIWVILWKWDSNLSFGSHCTEKADSLPWLTECCLIHSLRLQPSGSSSHTTLQGHCFLSLPKIPSLHLSEGISTSCSLVWNVLPSDMWYWIQVCHSNPGLNVTSSEVSQSYW